MRSQLINIVIFITLYEKETFRKTSSELGVSLGTISKSIKSLEEDSPSPLFIKSNGDFKPTTYAIRYMGICQRHTKTYSTSTIYLNLSPGILMC